MSERVRRRLFERVLIWEPSSGTIFDLPTRYVLPMEGPSENEEYANLTTGSKRPIRRTNRVQVPVTARELALMGEVIQRTKCPVKAAFIGGPETDNWLWLEPTRLQVRDPSISSGDLAQKVLELESNVFYPGIWEGEDLLAGVPWQGTKDWKDPDDGGVFLRPEGNIRPGYEGPLWQITAPDATGRTIQLSGATTDLDLNSSAIIRIEFPAWGGRLRLDAPPGYSIGGGALRVYGYGGTLLTSDGSGDGATVDVPEQAWEVEVVISDADARPRLRVEQTGAEDVVVQVGRTTPDCSPVDDPNWTPFPDPNEPPFWIQKERLLWEPDNIAPAWDDRDSLVFEAVDESVTNQPPTWDDREDLSAEKPEGSTATYSIEETTTVYTAEGGLSDFDYPGGSAYSILFDDLADGQIVVDENYPGCWVAQDGGITRFDPLAKSLPPPTTEILDTGGDNVRGLAIDRATRTLYFTYQSKSGLYCTDYDGQHGENEVTANLSGDEWYLAVDSLTKSGYIFAASAVTNNGDGKIIRFDIDGANKTTVIDGANQADGSVYPGIAISQTEEKIVWELEKTTEKHLRASNYDGTNIAGLVGSFANVPNDPFRFGVADSEGVVVTVSEVENGFANVSYYALPNRSEPNDISITDADTGKRVTTSHNYSISGNSAPTFENRDDLRHEK